MDTLRIAICDDEQIERELLEKYIHEWQARQSHPVTTASFPGGADLLHMHNRHPFDLILLDIAMPMMDGLETFKRMKESNVEIPVIFPTASGYEDDVRTAISLGAVNYLKKPFFPDELLKRVAMGLEKE